MVVFVACWIRLGFRLNGMLTFMCGRGGREKVFSPLLFIVRFFFSDYFLTSVRRVNTRVFN